MRLLKVKTERRSTFFLIRVDLCFRNYKDATKINENGHNEKHLINGIYRQKAIEEIVCCKFISINPDEQDFNIHKMNNIIKQIIKQINKHGIWIR